MASSAVCDRHPWHVRAKPTGDGDDEPLGEEPEVAPFARSFGGGALSGPGGARLDDVVKVVRIFYRCHAVEPQSGRSL